MTVPMKQLDTMINCKFWNDRELPMSAPHYLALSEASFNNIKVRYYVHTNL